MPSAHGAAAMAARITGWVKTKSCSASEYLSTAPSWSTLTGRMMGKTRVWLLYSAVGIDIIWRKTAVAGSGPSRPQTTIWSMCWPNTMISLRPLPLMSAVVMAVVEVDSAEPPRPYGPASTDGSMVYSSCREPPRRSSNTRRLAWISSTPSPSMSAVLTNTWLTGSSEETSSQPLAGT